MGCAASVLVAVVAAGTTAAAPSPAGAEPVVHPVVVEVTVSPSGWSSVGEPVTVAATVTARDDVRAGPAIGTVQFVDRSRGGSTVLAEAALADGAARLVTTALAAGRHELAVRYTGSASLRPQTVTVDHEVIAVPSCPSIAGHGPAAEVRQVYVDLLGRCPDPAGLAYWIGRLAGGTDRQTFAATIARTPEAVGRVVDDGYRTMLGRPADRPGRAYWVGRLLRHGRYDQLLADLGSSEEFWARAGATDLGFVVRVYERVLDRAPDTRGLGYWLDRYASGTSRQVLIRALATEDEPLGRIVTRAYYEILGRPPAPAEGASGRAHLRRTGDRSGLYADLIGRAEFAARAQAMPGADRGM